MKVVQDLNDPLEIRVLPSFQWEGQQNKYDDFE